MLRLICLQNFPRSAQDFKRKSFGGKFESLEEQNQFYGQIEEGNKEFFFSDRTEEEKMRSRQASSHGSLTFRQCGYVQNSFTPLIKPDIYATRKKVEGTLCVYGKYVTLLSRFCFQFQRGLLNLSRDSCECDATCWIVFEADEKIIATLGIWRNWWTFWIEMEIDNGTSTHFIKAIAIVQFFWWSMQERAR